MGVVSLFASSGASLVDLVGRAPPPLDEFDIRRVEFKPGEIRVRVTNPQRPKLTIATVMVDDAIVPFRLDGPATLGRLRSSTIVVPYQWVEDDPYTVGVTSSSGIETTFDVPAAVETRGPSPRGFLGYALIGFLVGIVPVARANAQTTAAPVEATPNSPAPPGSSESDGMMCTSTSGGTFHSRV